MIKTGEIIVIFYRSFREGVLGMAIVAAPFPIIYGVDWLIKL